MNSEKTEKLIKRVKKRQKNLMNTSFLEPLEYAERRRSEIRFLNQLLEILKENTNQ